MPPRCACKPIEKGIKADIRQEDVIARSIERLPLYAALNTVKIDVSDLSVEQTAEIVDFCVLEKYRRRGIGGKLMDVAEQIAFSYSDVIYLGVGLHSGYGSAQRMYARRGYIPDGSGVWYKDQVCEPYCDCCNDDDLVLYLSKHKT